MFLFHLFALFACFPASFAFSDPSAEDHSSQKILSALESPCVLRSMYKSYVLKHQYTRPPHEETQRLRLFSQTLRKILELRQEVSWGVDVTLAADLTLSEQDALRGYNTTTLIEEAEEAQSLSSIPSPTLLFRPLSFDEWRTNGQIGPVRFQIKDSCWAHAAVVPLEAQLALYQHRLTELSVQELYDCTYGPEVKINGQGGHAIEAFRYVYKSGRLGTWAESPITVYPKRHVCEYGHKTNAIAGYEVQEWPYKVKRPDDVMDHLRVFSPITVSVDSTNSHLLLYKFGSFKVKAGQCSEADHAIVLVGYTQSEYILKNSWGELWGRKGYVYWRRDGGDLCGMLDNAWYPFLQRKGSRNKRSRDEAAAKVTKIQ